MIAFALRRHDAPAPSLRRKAAARASSRPLRPPPSPGRAGLSVALRGLGKAFGGRPVLDALDLDIRAGEFVAVVGRSGCGKSTLLRLILGLEAPTTGTAAVDGAGPRRIMFQEPRLLPWASVVDNVAVGLGPDVARAERRARAGAALAAVGLADKAGAWPATLSGGQRQRVALARALVSGPGLLALDEPLGALDALTRIEMQDMIEGLWRDQGFTALLVTHDVAEAVALADRILVVEDGRIALDLPVPVARPRRRGDAALAALEGRILDHLLGRAPQAA
ncbi:ATP-binding cassette domain-containing protein [Methylobacterium oryzihabitans]|uniref:ATP-binding cassette domain-containing protein n=1 Tax=Methylobacterium oryzihabitans TaxID=2499852 RepID=A0A437PC35_9HYPH|nr:ATP-binding cassette domain-containing protein [Methylobacterium oryzihabitans]RVU19827.1 ATP-binding cassette domain-containing protein [Methylobacterium oryzihabitans]